MKERKREKEINKKKNGKSQVGKEPENKDDREKKKMSGGKWKVKTRESIKGTEKERREVKGGKTVRGGR